ncbi:hypothetical protein QR680_008502 [Steinernema hermaphroditum]|uniref:Serpentine receptor class gamma n=1 Tax=Steinernema hermaphroditum TaxID=289476 RepID=A0AA39IJ34_9BILA|nr:hypothetical protein QR680_008502 [Steinernema hermaphroditum]
MNTELVWLTVSLLYGIPSFVLYVVILFQLVRPKYRKQFNKPFFRLCFLIGVVDCLAYLMSYIFYTLPTYPLFSSFYGSSIFAPSPFTTFIQFFSYYLIYLQLFGNFFLTLNRFTAIVFPLKHARIWRLCVPFSIVFTVAVSCAPCWQLASTSAFYNTIFAGHPESGYIMSYDHNKYPYHSNSFNQFFASFVTCCSCLLLNIVSCIFLFLHTSKHPSTASNNRRVEMNFFLIALIIFSIQSVFGIHSMLIYISVYTIKNETMSSVLYVLVPWLSDLRYLSPPWVLVIVSTSVRKTIVKTLPQRLNKVSGTKVEPFATK